MRLLLASLRFFVVLLVFQSFFLQELAAVGAYPWPQKVLQSDSSVLTIRQHGDEWYHWTSTADGYRIAQNKEGFYEYVSVLKSGSPQLTGLRASNPGQRTAGEQALLQFLPKGSGVSPGERDRIRGERRTALLKSGTAGHLFAPEGEQRMLVILATFSDTEATYSREAFDELMNGVNGSFRHYYMENSGGRLVMESVVTAWVRLPNSRAYYAPEGKWGEFALHAVQAADAAGVNFAEFDNNGNGVVEGVAIIHQGPGKEVTGNEEDIWSHSWTLSAAGYTSSQRRFDGVLVDSYTAQPEMRNSRGDLNTIGVIAHEFGHNLGLPDYYDTITEDENDFDGTGLWDMMARGSYNGSPAGASPAHHNPLSKMELGWVEEMVLETAGRVGLAPVQDAAMVYRINGPEAHEYLLLENRQLQGFDSALPGAGLLVYQVDAEQIAALRSANSINAYAHQGLRVLAAGGETNTASAVFPGSLQVTQLTDEGTPAMRTWSDLPYNRSLTGIVSEGNSIAFDFMAIQNGSPLSLHASAVAADQMNVSWQPAVEGRPVLLAWSPDGVFGIPEEGIVYAAGETIPGGGEVLYAGADLSEMNHMGLEGATVYHYALWSRGDVEWSAPLYASDRTRAAAVTSFPWFDGFEGGLWDWQQELVSGSFIWEQRSAGAYGEPAVALEGEQFAFFHAAVADERSTRLVSPVLALEEGRTYVMDFWHYQAAWDGDQDHLRVLFREEGGAWTSLAFYDEELLNWTQRRVELPAAGGRYEIAFEGLSYYGYGLALDAVKVYEAGHGLETAPVVSGVQWTAYDQNSLSFSWSLPDPQGGIMVLARKDDEVFDLPPVGLGAGYDTDFAAAPEGAGGARLVYAGNAEGFVLSGLDHSSVYHISFFGYGEDGVPALTPLRGQYVTEQVFYPLMVRVNGHGESLEGARVMVGPQEGVSDQQGVVAFSVGHTLSKQVLQVEAPGYETHWQPFESISAQDISVDLRPLIVPTVTLSRAEKQSDLSTVFWNPVVDESFDGYLPFELSVPGWTFRDVDQAVTWTYRDLSFPNSGYTGSFMVVDPYYEGLLQSEHDFSAHRGRHVLAAFAARNVPNNDWLISPELEVGEGDFLQFMARSVSDKYGLEQFHVWVSNLTDGSGNYVQLNGEVLEAPLSWTPFRFDLADYAGKRIRFAIQYVSDNRFVFLLDNLVVGPEARLPLGALQKVTGADKRSVARLSPAVERHAFVKKLAPARVSDVETTTGRWAYELRVNGSVVQALLEGFSANQRVLALENCLDNTVELRVRDQLYGAAGTWSPALLLDACGILVLEVADVQGAPIAGARLKVADQELFSDEQGRVEVRGLMQAATYAYEVSAFGFVPQSGSFEVDGDVSLKLMLEVVRTDSMAIPDKAVKVAPNPVGNVLRVDGLYGLVQLQLFDVGGRLVREMQVEAYTRFEWQMSDLPAGVYILQLRAGRSLYYRKIVKE